MVFGKLVVIAPGAAGTGATGLACHGVL